jgi:hypothetical protein
MIGFSWLLLIILMTFLHKSRNIFDSPNNYFLLKKPLYYQVTYFFALRITEVSVESFYISLYLSLLKFRTIYYCINIVHESVPLKKLCKFMQTCISYEYLVRFNVFHVRALYLTRTLITNKCTKRVLASIVTHSYMFRPCWIIFRETFSLPLR